MPLKCICREKPATLCSAVMASGPRARLQSCFDGGRANLSQPGAADSVALSRDLRSAFLRFYLLKMYEGLSSFPSSVFQGATVIGFKFSIACFFQLIRLGYAPGENWFQASFSQ